MSKLAAAALALVLVAQGALAQQITTGWVSNGLGTGTTSASLKRGQCLWYLFSSASTGAVPQLEVVSPGSLSLDFDEDITTEAVGTASVGIYRCNIKIESTDETVIDNVCKAERTATASDMVLDGNADTAGVEGLGPKVLWIRRLSSSANISRLMACSKE